MRKKTLRILFYLVVFLLLVIILAPGHLRRAIIHGHANIDDYKIFENRLVQNAQSIPWQYDTLYNVQKIDPAQLSVFDTFGTTAFVVIQNKKIVHEEYWDGTSDTTRSNSFSVAKSIVSLLVGCLLDEGKIKSLEQPITDFLPEFKNINGFTLSIKDLLTMSSGIDWDEGYSSLFSPTTKAYYGRHLAEQMLGLSIKSEPGKVFEYQSCDTQLLALIIEKASGEKVSEYASEKLWKPLGAEHPAFWSLDRSGGVEKAYCCLNSTATDFARIGQMVLDSGQFNNQQIVSKAYLKQAITPAKWLKGEDGNPLDYYGYQFWMLSYKGHKIVYARGILGQYIFIIPSLNVVVVRLGTERSKEKLNNVPKDIFTYLDAAFAIISEKQIKP
jgi:CubicO group peptidase (beta-lactamase class C family)